MRANFDWIARPYRWLEYVALGTLLQQTRVHFLPALVDRRRAVVFGDGDGRFLAEFLRRNREVEVDSVDSSGAMLRLLGARCGRVLRDEGGVSERLRLHHADAVGFVPEGMTDLVVSHFFFDCLTQSEVEELVSRLVLSLAPDALWLVSDFRIAGGAMRLPSLLYVRLLYFGFRLMTGLRVTHLPDHASALEREGFELVGCHRRLFGMLTSELWRRRG